MQSAAICFMWHTAKQERIKRPRTSAAQMLNHVLYSMLNMMMLCMHESACGRIIADIYVVRAATAECIMCTWCVCVCICPIMSTNHAHTHYLYAHSRHDLMVAVQTEHTHSRITVTHGRRNVCCVWRHGSGVRGLILKHTQSWSCARCKNWQIVG